MVWRRKKYYRRWGGRRRWYGARKRWGSRKSKWWGRRRKFATRRRFKSKSITIWRRCSHNLNVTGLHGGTINPRSLVIQLSNIPDYTDWTTNYDYYKIQKILFRVRMIGGESQGNLALSRASWGGTPSFAPAIGHERWFAYRDPTGVGTSGSSEDNWIQEPSLRCWTPVAGRNNYFQITSRAWWRKIAYESATTTGEVPTRGYLPVEEYGINHYGLIVIQQNNTPHDYTGALRYESETWVKVTFKGCEKGKLYSWNK